MEHASSMLLVAPWLVPLMLAATLVIIFFMRDTEYAPPRAFACRLWCPDRQHEAIVEFREEVRSGMPVRRVTRCSLRADGTCDEACSGLPRTGMAALPRAALRM